MARIPRIALVGVLVVAAACGADSSLAPAAEPTHMPDDAALSASPTVTAAATIAPEPVIEASPTPADPGPLSAVPAESEALTVVAALDTRFPEASALLERSTGRIGVAVIAPDGTHHVGGDDETFALASVVKLPVMLATLERAALEERSLTSEERRLLDLMITTSSNSATDVLWSWLGEGVGVAALLEPLGITGIEYASDNQWGDSRASAHGVALVLEALIDDESAVGEEARTMALELMSAVAVDQRWGASAGVDLSVDPTAALAIKNGWYPETDGWLVNSAGVITVSAPDGAAPAVHALVVLSEGAATHQAGIGAIEAVAAAINHELIPPSLVVAPQPPDLADASDPPAASESEGSAEEPAEAPPGVTPVPTPAPVDLVVFGAVSDVLVPAQGAFLGSDGSGGQLRLWYELPAATASELLRAYAGRMTEFGWLEVAGPPSVVLAKGGDDRWVGLTAYPSADGLQLLEVSIAPAPAGAVAAVGTP